MQSTRPHAPCGHAAALRRLAPADPAAGALGEQLEALRQIRAGKIFKKEWFTLAEQLIPMLSSPLAEERLAAALPRIAGVLGL